MNITQTVPISPVIPAKAGIQLVNRPVDSRLRGNDKCCYVVVK
jgi:hypothetical protein